MTLLTPDVWFPTPLEAWSELGAGSGTFKWLLADDSWTPSAASDVYIDDMVADEITDASYTRKTLTGGGTSVDLATGVRTFFSDNPTWTGLAGGAVTGWVVLTQFVTNDTDSLLMVAYRVSHVNGGSNYTPTQHPEGLVSFRQASTLVQ